MELGRRDGRISTKASVQSQLPQPEFNLNQLNGMFSRHGLSQTDMIALSGTKTELNLLYFSTLTKFLWYSINVIVTL